MREKEEREERERQKLRLTKDPFDELTEMDLRAELAGMDEMDTMFDPDTHPKAFRGLADETEPIADFDGRIVDLMFDTLDIERERGETNRHNALEGLPELDDLGDLDITDSGLGELE